MRIRPGVRLGEALDGYFKVGSCARNDASVHRTIDPSLDRRAGRRHTVRPAPRSRRRDGVGDARLHVLKGGVERYSAAWSNMESFDYDERSIIVAESVTEGPVRCGLRTPFRLDGVGHHAVRVIFVRPRGCSGLMPRTPARAAANN